MEKILIFVETKEDRARKVSLELLSEFRRMADGGRFSVEAVVLGRMSLEVKEQVLPYVTQLVHINDPVLDAYTPQAYAMALGAYAKEVMPKLIAAGATQMGRDFMPRTAVVLGSGIVSDVTAADWLANPMTFVRPIYGGKVLAEMAFTSDPAVVTTRPNTFEVTAPGDTTGVFVERCLGLSPENFKASVTGVEETTKGKTDLTEAEIIVSGGHGLKSPENFKLLEYLAGVIGGTVGATRSVVDAKWRDHEDQVGKSGKTVSPKLYIAAGISGAIHHIMGMDTSRLILAINQDEAAPIFKYADYGIVGDLFEVVPAMTEEFKKKLGK